jgi:hypothetical protein
VPFYTVRYKIEQLCQLRKSHFEAEVLFSDNLLFLVRRDFVADF